MSAAALEGSAALEAVLGSFEAPVAVAVSGGVDSLTLAAIAHRVLGPARVSMHHAVSAAVPAEATARTRALAAERGWRLEVLDAGELADPRYVANPSNRCFFCKTNLYGAIAAALRLRLGAQDGAGPDAGLPRIVSGTNLDDLSEYRPGLDAAREHGVRHPFVEAGIGKAGIRALAAAAGLGSVSRLPASPCLSSRVETGIAIDPALLARIEAVEIALRARLGGDAVIRCRIRGEGMVIELDERSLAQADTLARVVAEASGGASARFAAYRNGSAFVRRVSA